MVPINQYVSRTFIVLAAIILLFANTSAVAETYKVDASHTYVLFKIKHLNTGYSYGRFNDAEGTFFFDPQEPAKSNFEVSVPAVKIDTDNAKRDGHLRSEDFFNILKYRRISFKSTAVKKTGDNQYEISGDLTLLDKTLPLTVTAVHTGGGKDPWGNYRQGFESTFTIQRSQWGMDYMLTGLSDDVVLTVSIEGILQK